MLKKLLASLMGGVIIASMCTSALASEISVPEGTTSSQVSSDVSDIGNSEPDESDSSNFKETLVEEANLELLDAIAIEPDGTSSEVDLSAAAVDISNSGIELTGETLEISKARTGNALTSKIGNLPGTLTSANTMDYYTFSSSSNFFTISKIVGSNSNYTMTLGVVDYSAGTINLTNYVTAANQQFMATIGSGDYAWVIQSSNGTYGSGYQLQYNMSIAATDTAVYVTSDLQKLYSIGGEKLRINNQIQNVDYAYDREVEFGEFWNILHISMKNANVKAEHVGGVRYKEGSILRDYPNAILLSLQSGGTFYHSFWQNPPHVHFVERDMYKIPTPRVIDSDDIGSRGGHYLLYDITTGRVVEMISGLVQPWSAYGDRSDLAVY